MIPIGSGGVSMPGCELYVKIDEPFQGQVAEEWIRRVVEKTLIQEEIDSTVELGLVITDDETIRQLNRKTARVRRKPHLCHLPMAPLTLARCSSPILGRQSRPESVNTPWSRNWRYW
jgi:ssRNA-specific RNase YbeY (16S rRNA maturation enzyme)